jgi:hypothetical protein
VDVFFLRHTSIKKTDGITRRQNRNKSGFF